MLLAPAAVGIVASHAEKTTQCHQRRRRSSDGADREGSGAVGAAPSAAVGGGGWQRRSSRGRAGNTSHDRSARVRARAASRTHDISYQSLALTPNPVVCARGWLATGPGLQTAILILL